MGGKSSNLRSIIIKVGRGHIIFWVFENCHDTGVEWPAKKGV